jgi:colanic acid/amylovoran biosynthesis glycosyltransferase
MMTLCIASRRFDEVSETFISDHVLSIAPGSTILMCLDPPDNTEQYGCPALGSIDAWLPLRSSKSRVINSFRYRWKSFRYQWKRYVDASLLRENRLRVRSFLKDNRAKAVLAEFGPMGCLLARACREAEVPLYVHFHGEDASLFIRNARQVRQYRAMFRYASGLIAPSHFLASNLKKIGCPSWKLHVSPYGVDPERFKPSHRIPKRAIAVGRLVEKKAPHLTIEAFARVVQQFPEARLDLVGGGPLEEKCRALVRERGLNKNVYMHGAQNSSFVVALMREASLFVQHSVTANGETEGLPVAILEAMASALPVVSTRHSGIPEAVLDNVTGYLVDEHNVDGMGVAMTKLFDHPKRAACMGVAGRERVLANFTQEMARDRLRALMRLPAG